MKRIVLITDCSDIALNEIRGAIYSNAEIDNFVFEPPVFVDNYSIINTSFAIRLLAEIYPADTMICVIVNPLKKRTERIIGRTRNKNILFEGTNTGAFGWLLKDFGCSEIYELHDPGFVQFGGKNVHAPAVGKSLTHELNTLGNPFSLARVRDIPNMENVILHIDNFGNIKIHHRFSEDIANDSEVTVYIGDHSFKARYLDRMMSGIDGELVVYEGSSFGFSEIGIVRGNAAMLLQAKLGQKVEMSLC